MLHLAQRQRYARQLLLEEIGEAGQERLCATRVRISATADPRAATIARDYLARAGLELELSSVESGAPALEIPTPDTDAVKALAGRLELEEAAAALAGAFAAVEAIKAVLGLSAGPALSAQLALDAEVPT